MNDNLEYFLFLIIAIIIGIIICKFLLVTSIFIIIISVIIIFIIIYLIRVIKNKLYNESFNNILINQLNNDIYTSNGIFYNNKINNKIENKINNKIEGKLNNKIDDKDIDLIVNTSNSDDVDMNKLFKIDKPPLDNLEPKELLKRLNYIYDATANPLKLNKYNSYKSNNNYQKMIDKNINNYYPFLDNINKDKINKSDCVQTDIHCYQNFNILNNGITNDNKYIIAKEDFNMPFIPVDNNDNFLFMNSDDKNLDINLNNISNENPKLMNTLLENKTCNNCKLTICENNNCYLQNTLFM